MIDKEYYTKRISETGPVGLVALNFELTLDFLLKARKMYLDESKDIDQARHLVTRAREGIENLIQSLDFDVPLASDFYEVYKYAYGLLCDVQQSRDGKKVVRALDEAAEIMESFLKAWKELAEKTVEEPLPLEDGPKVYAGLTYGKDGKAKEYVENIAGGYKA